MVGSRSKTRHQLFLTKELSARLEALAARPGATKSSILVDALTHWLDRRGASELEERFQIRLDRMSRQLARIERDGHVAIESLALFVRYQLMVTAPLPDNDSAARAVGRDRFNAFVEQVARQLATGRRSLGGEDGE